MAKKCTYNCVSFRNGHPLTDEDRVIIARNWMNQRMQRGEFGSYKLLHATTGEVLYDSSTDIINVEGITLSSGVYS